MNREQKGALLRYERMVDMLILVADWKFRIQHVTTPDGDDETRIVQLEGITDDYFYTSWPNCPFHTDEVIRINNGTLGCTMTYWGRAEHDLQIVVLQIS